MIDLNQRDIVLVNYPFTNFIKNKVRPTIILSNNNYNQKSQDALFVALTTKSQKINELRVLTNYMEKGSLKFQTYIRYDKINLLKKSFAIKKIGKVKKDFYKKIVKTIVKLIEAENGF